MKKHFLLATFTLFCGVVFAQNFNPPPSDYQAKLEKFITRYGTTERMYLIDEKAQTFDTKGGNLYIVAFVYDGDYKGTRRMLVYEVGSKGEKMNPKYPSYSKGYRATPNTQMFHVRLDPAGDANAVTKYKIDADDGATVYIYKVTAGVK